jgi:malonyl CoA-acyl carrier protein transacylase
MRTYLFPGQGSQAKGMGAALFDEFPGYTQRADNILGYSIRELCVEDPRQELNKTQFTQPALYVVNALSWFKKLKQSGKPDFLAGHSLGEFNALLAAECFDFETGLRLVKKRGQLMGQVTGGGMAAILNATRDEIEATLAQNGIEGVDLANYNTPSQIVISGLGAQITQVQPFFQVGKMLYYPLNTSGAFHSRYMQSVKDEFQKYLAEFEFATPAIPVIANVTARPYESGQVREGLASQIASTVRWSESMQYLMALGLHRASAMAFEEVGFGDVLTRLDQTIKRQTERAALEPYLQELRRSSEAAAPTKASAARDRVSVWNGKHPVGTRVKSALVRGGELETRTEAQVLFGHRAAVYLKGFNGYFDLDEVVPLG